MVSPSMSFMKGRSDKKGLILIELDKVLDDVKKNMLFPESESYINTDLVTADKEELEKRRSSFEFFLSRLEGGEADLDPFPSVSPILRNIRISHQDIDAPDIYSAALFLSSYFKSRRFLSDEFMPDENDELFVRDVFSYLDSQGGVNLSHPRIYPLIKEIEKKKDERSRYTLSFMKENAELVMSENPSFRDQRLLIPIRAEKKAQIKSYIHSSSSSGQTLYAEPFALVDLNNSVFLAEDRLRAEIMKIKHELSERLRYISPYIEKKVEEVKSFDFFYTFSLWIKKNRAEHVEISNTLSLIEARHPLLYEKAVPISITLEEKTKAIVFSGANAGGKTVSMKTIALLAAINQISTYIPASGKSKLPLFSFFLADIGDNQDILSDASTFSAHLKNIRYITEKADKNSLVLLDELGSGTDPKEGSAFSIATLEYLKRKARLTLISSHYSDVKNYAYVSEDIINASLAFDDKSGVSLYKIIAGLPGDSHALSAARRAGINSEIIKKAEELLKDNSAESVSLINSLISKSRSLDKKISQAENERRTLKFKKEALEKKIKENDDISYSLEKEGLKELNRLTDEIKRKLERLVMEIRTGGLDKEKIKSVKDFISSLDEEKEKVSSSVEKKRKEREEAEEEIIFSPGEPVFCGESRSKGKIIKKVRKNQYQVALENGLKLTLSSSLLTRRNQEKSTSVSFAVEKKNASYVVDYRGLSLAEAKEKLDEQIEAALYSNVSTFSIIHGFGDGILMRGLHEELKKNPHVSSYYFARPEDGGMGKTYVALDLDI